VELPEIEPVSFRRIFAGQREFQANESARKCVKRPGKTPNGVDAVNGQTETKQAAMVIANQIPADATAFHDWTTDGDP
jgi:hypothetical protein